MHGNVCGIIALVRLRQAVGAVGVHQEEIVARFQIRSQGQPDVDRTGIRTARGQRRIGLDRDGFQHQIVGRSLAIGRQIDAVRPIAARRDRAGVADLPIHLDHSAELLVHGSRLSLGKQRNYGAGRTVAVPEPSHNPKCTSASASVNCAAVPAAAESIPEAFTEIARSTSPANSLVPRRSWPATRQTAACFAPTAALKYRVPRSPVSPRPKPRSLVSPRPKSRTLAAG